MGQQNLPDTAAAPIAKRAAEVPAKKPGFWDSDDGGKLSRGQKYLFGLAVAVWVVGWLFILRQAAHWTPEVPYWLTVGLSTGLLGLATFAAFFVSKGTDLDKGLRTAIAAALVVFYMALVIDLLTIPGLIDLLGTGTPASGETPAQLSFGQTVFNGLSGFVGIVLAFYFAAAAAEKVADKVKEAVTEKATTAAEADKAVAETQASATRHVADQELAAKVN